MKIIIRDVFKNYFPKYFRIYEQISAQLKNKCKANKLQQALMNQQHFKVQEEVVPSQLGQRRSTNKKQKKASGLNLGRNKSVDEYQRSKSVTHQKQQFNEVNNVNNQYLYTAAQKQRLNQIVDEKKEFQLRSYIQNHKFYHSQGISFTVQQCIKQIKHIFVLYLRKLLSTKSQSASKSHERNVKEHKSNSSSRQNLNIPEQSSHQESLYKLSLYLNRETNKQIFTLYEHILASSTKTGISYDTLSKKLKTDIINISHYCCKLKKMRFIDWQHRKQGIVVFPKKPEHLSSNGTIKRDSELVKINLNKQQNSFDYSKSFIFHQLTLNENILLNVASATSITQGGLTNQQIKYKIMKHAQNKMVRRTVEGMKNIQRSADRQGKVFEFKYRKQTQLLNRELDKKRIENSGVTQLTQKCRNYLNKHYSMITNQSGQKGIQKQKQKQEFHDQIIRSNSQNQIMKANKQKQQIQQSIISNLQNQQLLLSIINTKLTDYISSIGIKQSKRQCTPLKLNRYITILNYLQQNGPDTQYELRRHIIQMQKQMEQANGIIHKRSMIGILEGLKKIQLIEEIEEVYYPKWVEVEIRRKQKKQLENLSYEKMEEVFLDLQFLDNKINQANKKKKIKLQDNIMSEKNAKKGNKQRVSLPSTLIKKISKKQHRNQIFVELMNLIFEKAVKRVYRKSFDRIIYVQRKKESIPMFNSQQNLFYLLDQPQSYYNSKKLKQHATTLQNFISQIDLFVQKNGKKIENFPETQYEIVKYIRTNPSKNVDTLKSKYGKNWRQKFMNLQNINLIKINEEGYVTMENFQDYLV